MVDPQSPPAFGMEPLPPGTSVKTVLANMNAPVALAFDPYGRLFYTEKSGAVRLYHPVTSTLQTNPVITFPVNTNFERGLMGIAIDPDFAGNHYIYAFYTASGASENRVVRFVENNGVGSNPQTIFTSPQTAGNHIGGNIHFGPDGKLYITVGDNNASYTAQDVTAKNGKIHRINSDGTIPPGNPVFTQTGALPSLYVIGLRNSFDFTFDPLTPGRIFASENGPGCDDEMNRIEPGYNYGWRPNYPCDDDDPNPEYNTIPPLWYIPDGPCCEAPTGVIVYTGTQIPQWHGHLFMAHYNTGDLRHYYLKQKRTLVGAAYVVQGVTANMDLLNGPDGAFWYVEGGGDGPATLKRIVGPGGPTATPTATPACVVSYASADVPRAIIDQGTITSTLAVMSGPTIASVQVRGMRIAHSYPEDLDVYLVSPSGTRVELFTDVCGGSAWTSASTGFNLSDGAPAPIGSACPPGTVTYKPEGSLAAMAGEPSAGVWALEVTDDGPADVGTLHAWGLYIAGSGGCATATPAASPTLEPAPTGTRTGTAAFTNTSTRTPTPSFTGTATHTRTNTATPAATGTPTRTASGTRTNTPPAKSTASTTRTFTPSPTGTAINTVTPSHTVTPTPTVTLTPTRTGTRTPTLTTTPSPSSTGTARASTGTPTRTGTSAPPSSTATGPAATPTSTATGPAVTRTHSATPTPCAITFRDVAPTDFFYEPVRYLYCAGVISGYEDNTFRPFNNTTRSQMVKIVVLGFEIPLSQATTPTFADVPTSNPFFQFVETAAENGIIAGYQCGGPGEPCDPENRPYFRPYNLVTRGQLSKIVVSAAGWPLANPPTPTFRDVLPNTAFYTFVETAYEHGIISGYNCGGPGEPCPGLYFRQFNNATRGQIAKIVYSAVTQE